ncbi:MAG: hypothetical protein HXX08_12380 [Chloroflexi bacterium]|uniref:Lipoprotein n=1 Tax=Candidatus Chlorohelix allophototropha TaxID=3003348 RepID=A0A8T7M2I4_9CHLR|nr:hypothetical protein [Chloroflexota bacterium]WJW66039.1 hypothetical protein OZ401_001821 [Chloroflexota bacterium L227-S17]
MTKKDSKYLSLLLLSICTVLLLACGDSTATPLPQNVTTLPIAPTATTPPIALTTTQPVVPTATIRPTTQTATTNATTLATTTQPTTVAQNTIGGLVVRTTPVPTVTLISTPTNANGFLQVGVGKDLFIEDRSTPVQLVRSYYNAISRQEYARAFSYWGSGGGQVPGSPASSAALANTYKNLNTLQLSIGAYWSGAAAGSTYYSVPLVLSGSFASNVNTTTATCFQIQQPRAINFGAPPFNSMAFITIKSQQVAADANSESIAEGLCQSTGNPRIPPSIPAAKPPIESDNFVDDRSTSDNVLRSYFNSINRKEYVRAYSYWESGSQESGVLQPYTQFEQGYKNTVSDQLSVGNITSNGAAGSIYYSVPVVVVSRLIGDRFQTFVGCYTIRQSNHSFYGEGPFVPLVIYKANLQEVPANTDTPVLLQQAVQKCSI